MFSGGGGTSSAGSSPNRSRFSAAFMALTSMNTAQATIRNEIKLLINEP
jgi:hypothetical protein